MSQSDFAGNNLHIAIQGKRRKQNKTLAGMPTYSDFIHTIKATSISPNPAINLEKYQGRSRNSFLPHCSEEMIGPDTTAIVASRIKEFNIKKRIVLTQDSFKALSVTGYKMEFLVQPVQFVSPGPVRFSNEETSLNVDFEMS